MRKKWEKFWGRGRKLGEIGCGGCVGDTGGGTLGGGILGHGFPLPHYIGIYLRT